MQQVDNKYMNLYILHLLSSAGLPLSYAPMVNDWAPIDPKKVNVYDVLNIINHLNSLGYNLMEHNSKNIPLQGRYITINITGAKGEVTLRHTNGYNMITSLMSENFKKIVDVFAAAEHKPSIDNSDAPVLKLGDKIKFYYGSTSSDAKYEFSHDMQSMLFDAIVTKNFFFHVTIGKFKYDIDLVHGEQINMSNRTRRKIYFSI